MPSDHKFHGVSTHIPKIHEFPLPGNTKGGPDIMVFGQGTDAVDVSCCSVAPANLGEHFTAHLKARYDQKIKKYREFQQLTQYRIVPFVVSHLGVIAKETTLRVQAGP